MLLMALLMARGARRYASPEGVVGQHWPAGTRSGVLRQHVAQEVVERLRVARKRMRRLRSDGVRHLLGCAVARSKGWMADGHLVQQGTKCPAVRAEGVAACSREQLWPHARIALASACWSRKSLPFAIMSKVSPADSSPGMGDLCACLLLPWRNDRVEALTSPSSALLVSSRFTIVAPGGTPGGRGGAGCSPSYSPSVRMAGSHMAGWARARSRRSELEQAGVVQILLARSSVREREQRGRAAGASGGRRADPAGAEQRTRERAARPRRGRVTVTLLLK